MKSILEFNREELKAELEKMGLKLFRSLQIFDWIYKKSIFDFKGMRNISKEDQDHLLRKFTVIDLTVAKEVRTDDGEIAKYLFKTGDDHFIETVLIKKDGALKNTLCVSSQIGCSLNCRFCATARIGLIRNLSVSEILSQVLLISREMSKSCEHISNIVFMGMGEPFLNYDPVLKALKILNDKEGYALGARHMTVSTAGLIEGIKRFMDEDHQFRLAVSLNSPLQHIRESIMPLAKRVTLETLIRALKQYQAKTKRRITFEYIMLNEVNMDEDHVLALSRLLKGFKYNLNIIRYNPSGDDHGWMPSVSEVSTFKQRLKKNNIHYNERLSKGDSIGAGCGQLGMERSKY